jgi:hypothetical protein
MGCNCGVCLDRCNNGISRNLYKAYRSSLEKKSKKGVTEKEKKREKKIYKRKVSVIL